MGIIAGCLRREGQGVIEWRHRHQCTRPPTAQRELLITSWVPGDGRHCVTVTMLSCLLHPPVPGLPLVINARGHRSQGQETPAKSLTCSRICLLSEAQEHPEGMSNKVRT